VAICPRRIVADVLMMPALQISNPVEALIQMVINDPARSALRLSVQDATCGYSTLFLRSVPNCMQKPGLRDLVPLGTDAWEQKEEDRVARKKEVTNAGFMVGGSTYR
jgi:hypothetical protein